MKTRFFDDCSNHGNFLDDDSSICINDNHSDVTSDEDDGVIFSSSVVIVSPNPFPYPFIFLIFPRCLHLPYPMLSHRT